MFNRNVRIILNFFSFINNKATVNLKPTIGLANYFSNYKLSDGSIVNVNIMDTSVQEIFRALNTIYYKMADCCLLVYDITNIDSFKEIKYYNEQIKENCKKNVKVILLGNKSDLENERKVSSEKAAKYSMINDYIFMETSCFKNKNVADAFSTLIEITNIESKKNNKSNCNIILEKNIQKNKKNSFC